MIDYESPQPISEAYLCLQGEGKYAGIPHILVRTLGCRGRCSFCIEELTHITTIAGPRKAKDVIVGDRVPTPFGITIIVDTITRNVEEVIEIEFEDGRTIIVTPDHPFVMENANTIQAKYLVEGMEIIAMR